MRVNQKPCDETTKPSLLLVGTPKFHNPGNNFINLQIGDMQTAKRQREFEEIVESLAKYNPTHIAALWSADRQDELDRNYAEFRAGRYKLASTEVDQINFRLADLLNIERIHAVDWSRAPPGESTDYDFYNWALANGRGNELNDWVREQQAEADATSRLMEETPVSAWLRRLNSPEFVRQDELSYYRIAQIGDRITNPGAAFVGAWYARNLRILNNLSMLATGTDDRIFATYGAGNAALIRRLAERSALFEVVDPLELIPTSPSDKLLRIVD